MSFSFSGHVLRLVILNFELMILLLISFHTCRRKNVFASCFWILDRVSQSLNIVRKHWWHTIWFPDLNFSVFSLEGSDCVNPFVALQACIEGNPKAFVKDVLDKEEELKEEEKPAEEYKISPPLWSVKST